MTYLNPVIQYGFARLDREGAAAGLDGILISDLIPREYARFGRLRAKEEGTGDLPLFRQLKTVFLVAPNSSEERVAEACRAASGYIYLLSRTGVTGRQTALGQGLAGRLELIRKYTSLPVAVGFGIRSASQVEQVWEYAEGAIVGSAIVSFISEHLDDRDLDRKVFCYVKEALIPGC